MSENNIEVLLVEDKAEDAQLIIEYLQKADYAHFSVVHVEKLSDALLWLSEKSPDAVILDIGLSVSQGDKAFNKIIKSVWDLPVIVLTGLNDVDDAKCMVQQGVQDYLVKDELNASAIQRSIIYAIERNRYKQQMIASEKRQNILVQENIDSILIVNRMGEIRFVNPAGEKLLGYTADELLGEQFGLPIVKDDPVPLELINHRAGKVLYVDMRSTEIDWDDELMHLISLRDVTERVLADLKIKESEVKYRNLFSSIRDAILVTDIERNVIDCNPAFSGLFNYTLEEIRGKKADILYESKDVYQKITQKAQDDSNGSALYYPIYYRKKDKIVFPGESAIFHLKDNENNIIGHVSMIRDVTDRMKYEEELGKWENVFKNAKWGVAIGNKDIQELDLVNPAFAEMHGLTVEELIGQPVKDVFAPESWQDISEQVHLPSEKGYHSYEAVQVRKDGSRFPVQVDITNVENGSGEQNYSVINVIDITERKQIEDALIKSEAKYRAYIENSPIGIYVVDKAGMFKDVNQAACDQVGFSKEELSHWKISDLIIQHKGVGERFDFKRISTNGTTSNGTRLRRKDNTTFPVIIDMVELPDDTYMAYCTDITDREAAVKALRERDLLLNKIFDILPIGLWIADKDGNFIRSNTAGRKIWGIDPVSGQEKFKNLKARRLPSGDEIVYKDHTLNRTINEGDTIVDEVLEIDAFDGVKKTVLNYTAPIFDNQGNVQDVVIVNQDISDLKRIENSLRISETRYRSLFENIPMGVYRTTMGGKVLDANPAAIDILGYEGIENVIQIKSTDFYKNRDDQKRFYDTLIKDGEIKNFETRLLHKDGRSVDVLANAKAILDGSNEIKSIEGTITDITEFKRTTQALVRRDEEIHQLYEAGKLLNESLDLSKLYDNLQIIISGVIRYDSLCIMSYDETTDQIQCKRLWHNEELIHNDDSRAVPLDTLQNRFLEEVIRTGQSQVVNERVEDIGDISNNFFMSTRLCFRSKGLTLDSEPFCSAIFIPFKMKDQVVGALCLYSYQPNTFSNDVIYFLESLAHQIGVAASNAILYEQTLKRMQQLASLHEIDEAISNSFYLDNTLGIVINVMIKQLEVDAADILIFDHGSQSLKYFYGKGFQTQALQHTRLRLGEGYAGRVALNRKRTIVQNLTMKPNGLKRSIDLPQEGFVSYIGVPLIAKGKLMGVVEAFHRKAFILEESWLDYLDTLAGQAAIAIDNYKLFNDLQSSNLNLSIAYDATIEGWSKALDIRDHETEGHTQRVTEMTLRLARKMGVNREDMIQIKRGALLHDIGKMGIPDSILLKAGPLNKKEWDIMRSHPQIAYDLLQPIEYLKDALDIPYCHHEKWDGTGYPHGLKGEQIPLVARMFAVVDVWDALSSDRPYREAWPHDKVIAYIKDQSEKHFDPKVVSAFIELLGEQE